MKISVAIDQYHYDVIIINDLSVNASEKIEEAIKKYFYSDEFMEDTDNEDYQTLGYLCIDIEAYGITKSVEVEYELYADRVDESDLASSLDEEEFEDYLADPSMDVFWEHCIKYFTYSVIRLLKSFFHKDFERLLKWEEDEDHYYLSWRFMDDMEICVAHLVISGFRIDEKCGNYLKENFIDVLHTLIDENDTEYIKKLLETDLMPEKDIHEIISYAVEHTQKTGNAEPQLMIMEYVSQHLDGTDSTRFNL